MLRWVSVCGKVLLGLASLACAIVVLIGLMPILAPFLANMQHTKGFGIAESLLLGWVVCVVGAVVVVAVSRCIKSHVADNEMCSSARCLDVFRRKRATLDGDGFSQQDRVIVDEKICDAEGELKASAAKLADALHEDVIALLSWRRICLRQPALSLTDMDNARLTQASERNFARQLIRNQSSIDHVLGRIEHLKNHYGISPREGPASPPSPLLVAASAEGGPKNSLLRFFWRPVDVHVCVVKSLGFLIAVYCINSIYRGGTRWVRRGAKTVKWAFTVAAWCFAGVVALSVPPLVFDRDSPAGRRCANMLCKFYIRCAPRVQIAGLAGMEEADVPYLHVAAATGRRIAVESLIAAGADPRAGMLNKGPTPREFAAYLGHSELMELLPSEQSDSLSVAVTLPNLSRARWLIWSGGTRSTVNVPDRFGLAPLHYAILSGNLPGVQFLIDQKADPNICSKDFPLTPLHAAAFRGNIAIVEFLLKNGADPDTPIETETPFMCAKMVANLGSVQRAALEVLLRTPLPATRYHTIALLIEGASHRKQDRETRK